MTDENPTEGQEPQAPVTPPAPTGDVRTFTQDEVNAMMGQVRKETRAKYADYEDLKQKASLLDEQEEAKKSELEKAQERIAAMERAQAAQQQTYRDNLIKAETKAIAAGMGFQNPDDAGLLADLSSVEVGENGTITGIKEALDALAKSKPYLLNMGKPAAPNMDTGSGNPPAGSGEVLSQGTQAMVNIASQYGYNIDPAKVKQRQHELKSRSFAANRRNSEE